MNSTHGRTGLEGLPQLQVGTHLVPEDGACLMEYVSVLAGTAFSDHPRCTDPILAALARLVNDASTDAGRPLLVRLAPALAATPTVDAHRSAAIVCATLAAARTSAGGSPGLGRHLRRAQQRHERVTGAGPLAALTRRLDVLHRRGPARRRLKAAVTALCALPEPQRDAALRAALDAATTAASGRCPTSGVRLPPRPVPSCRAGARIINGR
jgi:hypothetical protein